jgi:hypothetical protein
MPRLPTGPNTEPTFIYNPLREDFKCLQAGVDNIQTEYVIPSRQMKSFPKYVADHITRHLAQRIALERTDGLSYELKYKEAVDKITNIQV